MELRHPDGQRFGFDAGALCLELACTTGGEGFRARFEVLHEPDDVAPWAAASRFDARGVEFRATARELATLKELREAVWSAAYAVATGHEPPDAAIETVNRLAAGPPPVPTLVQDAATWREPLTLAQLTTEIARDAVTTFGRPTRDRIRMCGGDNCYLIYLDHSRGGRRRWCSMQRCGNRHKVREFRGRQEDA